MGSEMCIRDRDKGHTRMGRKYDDVAAMDAENMGLTQYVGSAGGSSQGTPVSYGGIALPESDVASLVATDNPMDATIGTVTGTMGAEGTYTKSMKDKYGYYEDTYDSKKFDNPSEYLFDRDNSLEDEISRLQREKDESDREVEELVNEMEMAIQERENVSDPVDLVWAEAEIRETRTAIHAAQSKGYQLVEKIEDIMEEREDLSNVHFGAEEIPVVPDPSSFPSGYGRVLCQQTDPVS